MGDTLHISRSLIDALIVDAGQSCEEICGLLLCKDEMVRRPCANVHPTPRTHFELDPKALLAAHRAARLGGPSIVGHYHSHPSGSPIPSAADAAAAFPDDAIWVIVAHGAVRAWRAVRDGAVQGRFDPVELVVTPPCA